MKRTKKIIISILATIFLVGCGQSGNKAESTGIIGSESVLVTSEAAKVDLEKIASYELQLNGVFDSERAFEGKIEITERKESFQGYPKDIEVITNDSKTVEIQAIITDDFFKIAEPVKISYELNADYVVSKATIENNGKIIIEPVQPFDLEMFYDESRKLVLKYQSNDGAVEKTAENPRGLIKKEIPITKDNIEKIEYIFNTDLPEVNVKQSFRDGSRHDFNYTGSILFTCKDGDKYICTTHLYFKPIEKELYRKYDKNDNSPVWDIVLVSVKKVE